MMNVQCAWCKRFKQPDGSWSFEPHQDGPITHGICEDCKAAMTGGKDD